MGAVGCTNVLRKGTGCATVSCEGISLASRLCMVASLTSVSDLRQAGRGGSAPAVSLFLKGDSPTGIIRLSMLGS